MSKKPNDFYRFCPKCGGSLGIKQYESEEYPTCTVCGFVFYQTPKPCTGMLIHNEKNELLFVQRARDPRKGTWDVPGGFLNMNEDADAALYRETEEELHVRFNLERRMGGYFDWYEFQDVDEPVLVLYYAGTITGTPKPDDDVAECQWFSVHALPENLAFDHIRRALADYVKEGKA